MTTATSPAQGRAAAARWVAAVLTQGRSLDDLLASDPDEGSARGLKRSLCYGTLRWHFRLAAVLQQLSTRPVRDIEPQLQALLEVAHVPNDRLPVAVNARVPLWRELHHQRLVDRQPIQSQPELTGLVVGEV